MKVIELFEDQYYAKEMRINDPKQIAKLLEKECSTFVKAYRATHDVLVRGIRELDSEVTFAEALIRPDREPLFMPKNQHKLINDAMIKLGLKAHRGNSIFCTSDLSIARQWGRSYAVFPVDGWTGTVFRKIKNYYVFDRIHDQSHDIIMDLQSDKITDEQALDEMVNVLYALEPHSFTSQAGLETVLIESYDDVLITGKKYYAVAMHDGAARSGAANDIFSILGI